MRRLAALLLLPALVTGCLGQADPEPAPIEPTDEPTPEDACATRGLLPASCEVFCTLNPETCGLPPPIPDPYPPVVTLPPTVPTAPGVPALNGTAPTLPDVCATTGGCGGG